METKSLPWKTFCAVTPRSLVPTCTSPSAPDTRLKSRQFGLDLVVSEAQRCGTVPPLIIGQHRFGHTGIDISDGEGDAR